MLLNIYLIHTIIQKCIPPAFKKKTKIFELYKYYLIKLATQSAMEKNARNPNMLQYFFQNMHHLVCILILMGLIWLIANDELIYGKLHNPFKPGNVRDCFHCIWAANQFQSKYYLYLSIGRKFGHERKRAGL